MTAKSISHANVRKELDAVFVGDDMKCPIHVREHMRECPHCRKYFDGLAAADDALVGQSDESTFSERFSNSVMRASLAEASSSPGFSAWFGSWFAWVQARPLGVAMGALAAVLLLVAVWWKLPGGEVQDDLLQPRSAVAPGTTYSGVRQVEVLCVARRDGQLAFLERDKVTNVLDCGRGDELKFTYVHKTDGSSKPLPWVTLFAVGPKGVVWYEPVASADGSIRIEETGRLKGLGEAIRVAAHHDVGTYEVYGVFTAAPLGRAALEAHLAGSLRGDGDDLDLDGVRAGRAGGPPVTLGIDPSGKYTVRHVTLRVGEAPE